MSLRKIGPFAIAAVALCAAAALADTKPLRHLEYHFQVGLMSETTTHDSGITTPHTRNDPAPPPVSASGINKRISNNGDDGTIDVDVVGLQPDASISVVVSEHNRTNRNAAPVNCLVYGSTYLVCDKSKEISSEEIELLRYLGRDFSTATVDEKNHWQYRQASANMSELSDYTIVTNANGMLSIDLQRDVAFKGAGGFHATTSGKITYNQPLSIPTLVSELTTSRVDQPDGMSNRTQTQVEFKLLVDSLAHAPHE